MSPQALSHSTRRLGRISALALGCAMTLLAQAQNSPVASPAMGDGAAAQATVRKDSRATRSPTAKQHEAQLGAIRQAILQATIDRPTRVLSSAWIDDKGALHESAHFQSQAEVRGVRVLSYLQDEQDTPPQVSAEVLPWGWRAAQTKATECKAPPRPWRLPLVMQTRVDTGFTGAQQFASQSVMHWVDQSWTQHMQASVRWRAQKKSTPPDNTYLRALTGPSESPTGWTAELVLKPHAPAQEYSVRQAWNDLNKNAQDWRWTLTFTLGERHASEGPIEPRWQMEQVIRIDPQNASQNPSAWVQSLKEQLQLQMQAWVAQLDKRSACEPVQFHVRRTEADKLTLQGGTDSGLRAGDRVLLINPSHVPSQMLEPGATQHLALAQVVNVGRDRTELQQLAGPTLAAQGHWMALPL
ncbi:hypothetical protein [Limnohabitans sp. G3-2]|uniref:hypothetical protein n=1 Tax=Limnohabitans sp. G3-2 TaxID=1100711 RepID=UPI000C1EF875|nr:hypothetical protein [Limnohabitans sp. G3-2]PIT74829.1 hypothetical protein B9Z31_07065 [Limnohabitans sp. G3-2]